MSTSKLIKSSYLVHMAQEFKRPVETELFSLFLKAGSTEIANTILEVLPTTVRNAVNIQQYEDVMGFTSYYKQAIHDAYEIIDGLILESNKQVLKGVNTGWLSHYIDAKNLYGTWVQIGSFVLETPEDAIYQYERSQKNMLERLEYKKSKSDIKKLIVNLPFEDELQHIIDYVCSEFIGESEDSIKDTLLSVGNLLKDDLVNNHYLLATDSPALDEIIAIGEYLLVKESLSQWAQLSSFLPSRIDGVTVANRNQHWEIMRTSVAKLIKANLPSLYPKSLAFLLTDQNANTPDPIGFKGLGLASAGALDFSQRLHPQNLRYDQQEQGNDWLDVCAGAIVNHYHMYIAIKQEESIRCSYIKLSDSLVRDTEINITKRLTRYYQQASEITS